jgi:exopolysaccharide biosynthesis protein
VFGAVSLFLLAAFALALAGPVAASELPLGPRSLDERRASSQVAPGVRWTRIVRSGGPWRVNVLSVASHVRVLVTPAGDAVGERQRPSVLARSARAVAAVNGGYFAADGNPVGVLGSGGRLLSEPVGGRSALVLGAPARVAAFRFAGSVALGGAHRIVDGVNRAPGRVPACGGRGGDRPTERADAVTTCTDASELVVYTSEWGPRTPRAAVTEAVVRQGVVTALRRRGGAAPPPDGYVLAGTGDAARLLDSSAAPDTEVELDLSLRAGRSTLLPAAVVGGGPRLLARGRVSVRGSAEGFDPLSAPWFFDSFVAARHPRTLAGVKPDGSLLLVTIDGRRPGWSAGVTLFEAARVMRALGAREALNLDGGGSTTMTVRGARVNRPSDAGGERPVSDALLVLP